MRGHLPLIAIRKRGLKPQLVRIETDPMPWRDWADWPEWSDTPMVEVEPSDAIRRLDLRCMVGLPVAIGGRDAGRVAELFGALQVAGASRVIAFVDGPAAHAVDSMETPTWPT